MIKTTSHVVEAFRRWGYLQADLDPLGRLAPMAHPDLDDATGDDARQMRDVYCGSIGVEFMHMPLPDRCRWIAERMEETPASVDQRRVLARIASAELFEHFLHARYVGTKRYSLEGGAALIPLLDVVLEGAAERGAEIVLIGMSHRGRLTVMAHVVGTPLSHVFAGFEDVDSQTVFGGGDVKYHQGATGRYETWSGRSVRVHLVSNPSHLEAVNPVVMGRVRARQERIGEGGIDRVFPITIHGDAAFAGQGIAAETLNLADLPGFRVGGTVHVIVNNLIGFTTMPKALHSSRFASDVAKRLAIPIFHVNGLDPDAVVRTARIATEYRSRFQSDVLIDLICYRRYGHSEVDDPTVTQPLLYRKIDQLPELWRSYAERIEASEEEIRSLVDQRNAVFRQELETGRAMDQRPVLRTLPDYWNAYRGGRYDPKLEVDTAVAPERLAEIAQRTAAIPEGFTVHPKVKKVLDTRIEMSAGKRPVDWGMAEALSIGSLLWDGMLVRLTGQDTRRGTFGHRHAVLVDYESAAEHVPLSHLRSGQGRFDVHDTPLSEACAVGFEYGFSRDFPDALVLWEAQFGDFANGAQVIVDQFLTAGEDKWDLLSGLVLLLPHGYEGQGPEHSSARFERYLQLCGEDNIQLCQPTTAAQYFHLLRRQALRTWRKPLVVLTPKGYLRAPVASSSLNDLAAGRFFPVLGDPEHAGAERVLVCSGKLAHELHAERQKRKDERTAIVRLEQIAPFPEALLSQELARFASAKEIVWIQEEPANMGALFFVRPRLQRLAGDRRVTIVKRPESASPATGSHKAHEIEQQALLGLAFDGVRSKGQV
jgi:2-oxoglutarate dehydrogenase E1 component